MRVDLMCSPLRGVAVAEADAGPATSPDMIKAINAGNQIKRTGVPFLVSVESYMTVIPLRQVTAPSRQTPAFSPSLFRRIPHSHGYTMAMAMGDTSAGWAALQGRVSRRYPANLFASVM
ncbi:hypothetical protein KLI87_30510 [Actinomadura sp. NEAU-AAG7]|nr:hypothetical protein [Actinomadura sp. NEAU-AAG7]